MPRQGRLSPQMQGRRYYRPEPEDDDVAVHSRQVDVYERDLCQALCHDLCILVVCV